jgi:hypothetical protein
MIWGRRCLIRQAIIPLGHPWGTLAAVGILVVLLNLRSLAFLRILRLRKLCGLWGISQERTRNSQVTSPIGWILVEASS